jgi:N6-adenosine-specific RNA methylase IME4
LKRSWHNITINDEYANLGPDLSSQEYESLKASTHDNGQYIPIIKNSQGVLLDGHSRYKICQELGIEPSILVRDFENESYEQLFVIDCNLKRRHLSSFQRTELALKAKPILEEIAKKNESLGGKGVAVQTPLERVDTELGKRAGVGKDTVRKVEKILKTGSKELQDRARKGDTSINYAYKSVNRTKDHKETPKLPKSQYNVILADPPWSCEINSRGSLDEAYVGMSKKEIFKLHIPSTDDSILFLWATNQNLLEALEIMKAWGFEYKANIVWIKPHYGTCSYVKGKHELLLLGNKGNMLIPEENNKPESVIETSNNSQDNNNKKITIYNIIEKMYPNCKYLELFASTVNSDDKNDWDLCYDNKGKNILESYYETISDAIQSYIQSFSERRPEMSVDSNNKSEQVRRS